MWVLHAPTSVASLMAALDTLVASRGVRRGWRLPPFARAFTDRFAPAMGVSAALALAGAVAGMGLCSAGAKWP